MRDMEYLTKEDLPYFEQLEKEGRAVIIRLDQTKLKDLDIDRFLEAHPDEIRQEELLSFLKENKAVLDEGSYRTCLQGCCLRYSCSGRTGERTIALLRM